MQLYDHQAAFMQRLRNAARKSKRILMVAPTGYGKSTLISDMFSSLYAKGKSAWFVIHRKELKEQVEAILQKAGVPYGLVVAGNKYDSKKNIQICMAQTLKNRIGLMKKPDLVFLDEAHISCSNTYKKILELLPETVVIGGTATPRRTDRKPLREIYDCMVEAEDTRWLIDNGYLAKYRLCRPPKVDVSNVHIKGGDYDQKELAETLDRSTITGDALEHYKRLGVGKKFVVFDYSVDASKRTAKLFTDAGFPCAHVDGTTPDKERKESLRKFRAGELVGLSNYSLFIEGVDIPDIECVILKRPTKSIIAYRQSIGRGLRKTHPDKRLLILDHAGCSHDSEHGLPCEEIEWSLDGAKKKAAKKLAPTKTCPICYTACAIQDKTCECGHEFVSEGRKEMAIVKGELEEVDIEAVRKNRWLLIKNANSLEDFREVARKLNYKKGWAWYAWKRKQEQERKRNK